jgi:hypothetical protein
MESEAPPAVTNYFGDDPGKRSGVWTARLIGAAIGASVAAALCAAVLVLKHLTRDALDAPWLAVFAMASSGLIGGLIGMPVGCGIYFSGARRRRNPS